MPIVVKWFNSQQSAVLMTFEGQWTWQTFYQGIDEAVVLLDTLAQAVTLVIDLSKSAEMPKGSIAHIRNAQGIQHPNIEKVVFIGMNTFMQMIGNLAARLNRGRNRRVYMVATMEEALQYICAKDDQLQ